MDPDGPVELQVADLATLPVEIPSPGRSSRASVSFYCGSPQRITEELEGTTGPWASLEDTDGGSPARVSPPPTTHTGKSRLTWPSLLFLACQSHFTAGGGGGCLVLRSLRLGKCFSDCLNMQGPNLGEESEVPSSHTSQRGQGLSSLVVFPAHL